VSGAGTAAGTRWPSYDELAEVGDSGLRCSWGVFGAGDEVGTLNFVTPAARRAAAASVTEGVAIDLSLPLNLPLPQLARSRPSYRHTIFRDRGGRDDKVDDFYLQGSTQWDGLAHVRFREHGYYGGRQEAQLDAGELSIERLAEHGMVGRGVLVDVAAHAERSGIELSPDRRHGITAEELQWVLDAQGTVLRSGDFLLLRTGWLRWYLALDADGRTALAASLHPGVDGLQCPGLDCAPETAEWLWNHRVAAVAADNPAVEALPVRAEQGYLHRLLVALLGMPFGELWNLEELAERCAALTRYEFLFSSVPLKIPGGVGSPGNGVALL